MNAATNARPAPSRNETAPRPAAFAGLKHPCVVTTLPGVDLARAAWLACLEMALTEEDYVGTLAGLRVTDRVPPEPGECHRDYAARAASAVMTAYVFGWTA